MFASTLQPLAPKTFAPNAGSLALTQPASPGQTVTIARPMAPAVVPVWPRALVPARSTAEVVTAEVVTAEVVTARADLVARIAPVEAIAPTLVLDASLEAISADIPESFSEAHTRDLAADHLQRLRQGEGAAWDEFVANWSPRLFSYLRYSLPTREDAEDVLSETLVATVEAIKHFDGKSQISTWLYSIARRKVADFWRKSSNTEELSDLFQAAPNGFSLEFREALAALPEQTRQALLLRYREGFNVSEVSEIMGRTYKATESLLSRGRTLLARQLQPEGE